MAKLPPPPPLIIIISELRLCQGRNAAVRSAFEMLEEGMRVLCVTAVEDRLQANVRTTLEMLRGANVRTWMLTGDKLETARLVAQNSSLVARHQSFYTVNVRSPAEARPRGSPTGAACPRAPPYTREMP